MRWESAAGVIPMEWCFLLAVLLLALAALMGDREDFWPF